MKQLTLNDNNWLFVPVPQEAQEFKINKPENKFRKYFVLSFGYSKYFYESFPFFFKDFGGRAKYPKDMIFLTTTTDITEEQAGEIGITYNDLAEYGITGRHAIIQIL